jgi:hypothetical protein
MNPGDLVFIMGDPSRPTLLVADLTPITHATPALVLEVDGDAYRTHVKVLVQGEALWMPSGFVKASNEEG